MTRTLDFKGRTAVITGAGSGIGAALAAALAARGANLALADINEARLNAVADALKSNEIKVTTHTVDVADKDQITAFAEAVEREHGAVNALFNNAGVALGGTFDRVKDDEHQLLRCRAHDPRLHASYEASGCGAAGERVLDLRDCRPVRSDRLFLGQVRGARVLERADA